MKAAEEPEHQYRFIRLRFEQCNRVFADHFAVPTD